MDAGHEVKVAVGARIDFQTKAGAGNGVSVGEGVKLGGDGIRWGTETSVGVGGGTLSGRPDKVFIGSWAQRGLGAMFS